MITNWSGQCNRHHSGLFCIMRNRAYAFPQYSLARFPLLVGSNLPRVIKRANASTLSRMT